MKVCSIEGCDGVVVARGWCRKHYNRWHVHGDPTFVVVRSRGQCRIAGCSMLVKGQGLCSSHYRRLRVYGNPEVELKGGGCLTCTHPDADRISVRLLSGEQHSAIADEVGISRQTINNHARRCLGLLAQKNVSRCLVCASPDRDAIEQAAAEGETIHSISERFGMKVRPHLHPDHLAAVAVNAGNRLGAVQRYVSQSLTAPQPMR